MGLVIGVVVGLVVVLAAILVALRKRGGSGERGALERGAAQQGQAQGLAHGHAQSQGMGPYGG
ncbi:MULTISPECIES: hypothetical protein [unclassified Streptomyces]|uniref:hypothetical protein n=1 Tax=unclassified Streptomyces TaxID=2593676 RepID=UPI002E809324|nr:hypothetical protein [Streptomyces sp. NBC_00523]WUD00305.1 hypothetical protein OHS17_11920 [Streptomyces sp. NBC_00523]